MLVTFSWCPLPGTWLTPSTCQHQRATVLSDHRTVWHHSGRQTVVPPVIWGKHQPTLGPQRGLLTVPARIQSGSVRSSFGLFLDRWSRTQRPAQCVVEPSPLLVEKANTLNVHTLSSTTSPSWRERVEAGPAVPKFLRQAACLEPDGRAKMTGSWPYSSSPILRCLTSIRPSTNKYSQTGPRRR